MLIYIGTCLKADKYMEVDYHGISICKRNVREG